MKACNFTLCFVVVLPASSLSVVLLVLTGAVLSIFFMSCSVALPWVSASVIALTLAFAALTIWFTIW